MEAQEEMAEGSVHEAETQYNIAELQRGTTYWEMLGQKLSAQNAIDKARENIALIEENIRLLEKKVENLSNNLEKTRLVSPIEGTLIETYANMGEIVTAGKPVAQIKDLDSIEIVALVDEDDLGGIKEGQAAEITINAYPNKTFEGEVRLVSNKSMEEMGVVYFKVYISFKETPNLLTGLSGDVRIETDRVEDTIIIPNDAIKERGEKDFVYIKEDGEIIEKEIKINASNNNFSSVSEGLKEGDKLLFPEDLEE